MTGNIGAAADIATGTVVGRVFEPSAGEAPCAHTGHGTDGALCLNCGTRLLGEHCHACGQSAHVHRSLGGIGHEIAHGVFHFEGKIWRTLPPLVLHPGALTRRYVNGERARFVSPLALFLFTVLLMFATTGAGGGEITKNFIRDGRTSKTSDYAREAARARFALTRVEAQQQVAKRASAKHSAEQLATLDRQASALRITVRALGAAADMQNGGVNGTLVDLGDFKTGWERLDHGIAKANGNPS